MIDAGILGCTDILQVLSYQIVKTYYRGWYIRLQGYIIDAGIVDCKDAEIAESM